MWIFNVIENNGKLLYLSCRKAKSSRIKNLIVVNLYVFRMTNPSGRIYTIPRGSGTCIQQIRKGKAVRCELG
jgi:hypothetical protein